MASVTLEKAQANRGGLIHQLAPGDELIVKEGNQPIARIVFPKPRVKLGAMRGSVIHIAPDFDAPLDDFKEYQE
jgi:antitoxin (DNA-binding transcriptional repressor) of toxin-antitoxin stability system